MSQQDNYGGNMERSKSSLLKPLLIVIAVIAAVVILLYKAMCPVDWRSFNDSRRSAIEQEFAISLDNTVPKRYWVPSMARDTGSCFTFYTDDYKAVMDSFRGEGITGATDENSGSAVYKCHVSGRNYYTAEFVYSESSKGSYKGSIVSYTQ